MRKLFVNVDGASRGNPGDAAIGIVLTDEQGHAIEQVSQPIGRTTNNAAEYRALIEGIRRAIAYAPEEAIFFTDNQLVANQINGLYQVREPHLQHLNSVALDLLRQLPKWRVNFIEREANSAAHRLAERAFREQMRSARERTHLRREIDSYLEELSLDDLRKVLAHLRRFRTPGI